MSTLQQDVSWAPSARAQEIPRRLPQPLTPESLQGLMRNPAYWDSKGPQFPTYQRLVKRGFEILYPGPVRRSDTGNMIDTPPLAPHIVAHQVDAVNREMAAMDGASPSETGSDKTHDGMVHVESHTRDGGKTEVSDYWRNLPSSALGAREPASGHGAGEHGDDAVKGDPETQNDPGQDTLPGQPGEDDLAEAKGAPKGAYLADEKKLKEMLDEVKPEEKRKWFHPEDEKVENRQQCTALVKYAAPGIGPSSTWRAGEKLVGPGNPPLEPRTLVATFGEDGKYLNLPTGNHAAIILGPGVQNGKEGYWVLDQWRGEPAQKRFISFNDPTRAPSHQAERYSIIRRKP